MSILARYLIRSLLVTLGMAIGIATFVMLMGFFARSVNLLASGVALQPLLLFIVFKIPQLLAYTVPIGLLVATLLTFNRLSADHEITALQSCGVSLPQLAAPLIVLSLLLCGVTGFMLFKLAPDCSQRANWLVKEAVISNILDFLAPQTYNDLGDNTFVYLGEKDGTHVRDVRLYKYTSDGILGEDITAASGEISVDLARQNLTLTLNNAIVVHADASASAHPEHLNPVAATYLTYPIDYGQNLNHQRLLRGPPNMTLTQLLVWIRLLESSGMKSGAERVELHKRAVLSMAPFTFLLLGIPFGLRVSRKENYSSLVIGLAIVVLYFGLVLFFEAQRSHPNLHPEICIWLPNLLGQGFGLWALWHPDAVSRAINTLWARLWYDAAWRRRRPAPPARA